MESFESSEKSSRDGRLLFDSDGSSCERSKSVYCLCVCNLVLLFGTNFSFSYDSFLACCCSSCRHAALKTCYRYSLFFT